MYILFSIFPSTCHWEFPQDIQWLLSGDFQSASRSKTIYGSGEECWRNNEEFVRHTGMYVVELGVGIGKGGESCRWKKGKRRGEERTNM